MLVVVGIAFELAGGSSELLISSSLWDWSAAATGLALVGDEDEWR